MARNEKAEHKCYKILSDNRSHTHCLPNPEDYNVGTKVECVAPRLQDGEMYPCGTVFHNQEKGISKKRKVWTQLDYGWIL